MFRCNDFPSRQWRQAIVNKATNEAYASLAISCLDVKLVVDSETQKRLISNDKLKLKNNI